MNLPFLHDSKVIWKTASYLDLLLSIGRDGQLYTSIYDKREDLNFHITNFPFLSSNISSLPTYCVFISQLIRHARAFSSYECFILRTRWLSSKLLKQGYLVERLKSSFRKFYGQYGDLIQQYKVPLSRMLNDILTIDQRGLANWSDFLPIPWPRYRAWLSPKYEWFPWSICNSCGMPAGTLTLPDTWFRPPFLVLACAPIVKPDFSNLSCLLDNSPWIPIDTFSICFQMEIKTQSIGQYLSYLDNVTVYEPYFLEGRSSRMSRSCLVDS